MRRPSLVLRLRSVLAGPGPARPSGGMRRSRAGRRSGRGRARQARQLRRSALLVFIAASASTALTGRSDTLMSAMRTSPPGAHRCRGSDHREVAVAARHLLHRHTGARSGVRERDLREDLVGLEGGGEVADEEVGRARSCGCHGCSWPRRSRRGRARSRGARRRDRREQGCRRSCRECGSRHVRCREWRQRAGEPASRRQPSAPPLGDGSSRRWRSSR